MTIPSDGSDGAIALIRTEMSVEELEDFDRVERSLTNISPDEQQIVNIEALRRMFKTTAACIVCSTPRSRERSLALTRLEESTMWAVKAVILNGGTE